MIEIINSPKPTKAMKRHMDMTREFIMEGAYDNPRGFLRDKMTPEEIALVEKAISEDWWIEKGEVYSCGVFSMDGDIYAFRSKLGLADICSKYDLWPEE